jgi:hypothetical protein
MHGARQRCVKATIASVDMVAEENGESDDGLYEGFSVCLIA